MEQVWRENPATAPFDMTSRPRAASPITSGSSTTPRCWAPTPRPWPRPRSWPSAPAAAPAAAAPDVWREARWSGPAGERLQLAARARRRAAPRLPGAAGGPRRPSPALRRRPGRPAGLVPGSRGRRRPVRGGPAAGRPAEVPGPRSRAALQGGAARGTVHRAHRPATAAERRLRRRPAGRVGRTSSPPRCAIPICARQGHPAPSCGCSWRSGSRGRTCSGSIR